MGYRSYSFPATSRQSNALDSSCRVWCLYAAGIDQPQRKTFFDRSQPDLNRILVCHHLGVFQYLGQLPQVVGSEEMSDIDHCRGAEQPQGFRRHLKAVQRNAKDNGMVSPHSGGRPGHTQTTTNALLAACCTCQQRHTNHAGLLRLVATALFVKNVLEARKNSPFCRCRNIPASVFLSIVFTSNQWSQHLCPLLEPVVTQKGWFLSLRRPPTPPAA